MLFENGYIYAQVKKTHTNHVQKIKDVFGNEEVKEKQKGGEEIEKKLKNKVRQMLAFYS